MHTARRPPGAASALRAAETAQIHADDRWARLNVLLKALCGQICGKEISEEGLGLLMTVLSSQMVNTRVNSLDRTVKDIKKKLSADGRTKEASSVETISSHLQRFGRTSASAGDILDFLHEMSNIGPDSVSPSRPYTSLLVPQRRPYAHVGVGASTNPTLVTDPGRGQGQPTPAPMPMPMPYTVHTQVQSRTQSHYPPSAATTVPFSSGGGQGGGTPSSIHSSKTGLMGMGMGMALPVVRMSAHMPTPMPASTHASTTVTHAPTGSVTASVAGVPESAVVKDVVFCLQGVDGTYLAYNEREGAYCLSRDPETNATIRNVPARTIGVLAAQACVPGALYRQIVQVTADRRAWEARGLVSQAMWAAIQGELELYVDSVAELGYQVDAAPRSVTLRRIVVWSQGPARRLRLVSSVLPLCGEYSGGALLSRLCQRGRDGDPVVHDVVERMLAIAGQPMLEMIHKWVSEGDLQDPYGEFFVMADVSIPDSQLWSRKYSVREEMIPEGFVDLDLAERVLLVGKSINFLRRCCGDTSLFLSGEGEAQAHVQAPLVYGDAVTLKSRVVAATRVVSKRITATLESKYHLSLHMNALKRYLLLGQGDFIQRLMDLLHSELAKPARDLFRHNLGGVLDHALRQSNAQFEDEDVINRLDFRVLQGSAGDSGWDVFSLDYRIGSVGPLQTLLSPTVMNSYLRIFTFLWRVRAAEHALNEAWRTHMNTSRMASELIPAYVGLSSILRRCYVTRAEMVHLIRQLQYYVMFEVIEVSWGKLTARLGAACTLDDLIEAHTNFLDEVLHKAMLTKSSERTMALVRRILDICVRFRHAQDSLAESLEAEALHLKSVAATVFERTQAGMWGLTSEDGTDAVHNRTQPRSLVPAAAKILDRMEHEFSTALQALRAALGETTGMMTPLPGTSPQAFAERLASSACIPATGREEEVDQKEMRYLAFRLDFNSFYSSRDAEWAAEGDGSGIVGASLQ